MFLSRLPALLLLFGLSWALIGCDLREGTIVYDVDFPRADANYGGGGSSRDDAGNTTATNDFGAGYQVSESDGSSSVIESGAGDTLTIRLVLEPLANVTLALVSVDTGEVTLSTNTLTFTPSNWNIAQTVNLSAVEDGIADGDQTTTVTVLVTGSGDKRYASVIPATDVSVTTVDSGTIISPLPPATGPGITITQSGANTTVTESGASDTITVVLNEAPTDNVTVAINKSNNGEISTSPATVTFTTSNWNVAQTVTISAVEDASIDGDKDTNFTVGVSASNDSNFMAVADASVPVSVIDSGRVPGIVITSTGSNNQVSENGTTTDTITLVLNTPPTDNVTITITDNDTDDSEVSYLPDNLTFTPMDWNVTQTVTLTALEDYVQDNHQTTLLTMTSSSNDATNDNLSSTTEVLTVDSQTAGGITISQSSLTLSESGATDTLTFKLNTPPLGNVTISLTDNDSDNSEISYSPTSLSFDSSNWNNLQTVTFSPLQDSTVDGNQIINLDVLVSSVGDPTYGSAMDTNRTVTVNDSGLLKPVLDNITVGDQQLTIYWQAQSVPDNYTLFWSDNDSPQNSGNFTISNSPTSTSYIHGGLESSLNYTYYLVANIGFSSSDNSTSLTNSPASLSCTPGYLPDNDSDLLVYYDFDDSSGEGLHDKSPANGRTASASAWPYDLTNTGGTLRFPPGCTNGMAGYFDSSSGYVENDNLNDTSTGNRFVNGNFTITMWFNAESDMVNHSGLMASKQVAGTGNDGDKWSWQLDSTGSAKLRWRSSHGANYTNPSKYTHTETSSTYSKNQWTHAAFVKHDNGTSQIYLDGALEATSSETQNTPMDKLFIGVNRAIGNSWKGYIDEFKVYGRALSQDEVIFKCIAYNECSGLGAVTLDNATAGVQSVTLNWSWSGPAGLDSYTIYWTDDGSTPTTSSNQITLSAPASSYVHSGLTGSTLYKYKIGANLGTDSSKLSDQLSATPSAFAGCSTSGTLSDPDTDLLVYYDFNNDLEDQKDSYGDGRYDLMNTGGTIKFAQGCGHSNAAYFDPSTGYAYNDNFTDDNESALSGNFTVTMWINGDADNTQYSAVYSTGNKTSKNHQLDVDSAGTPQIRLLVYNDVNFSDPAQITNGQWYHVAVTQNTSNQWEVFKNGVSVGTGTSGAAATWDQLKIGVNRNTENHWKGYIDEFKVFGRAFDVDDVKDACLLYGECKQYVAPATPDNLTATNVGDGTSVNVSWNAVNGVDNYTVYWTDNASLAIDPDNASTYTGSATVNDPTTSTTATGLTPGGNYDFTVIATNSSSTGSSSPATEVNLSTNPSVPTGLTATSPDNSTINLSWNASTGADNYTVYWNTNPNVTIDPSTPATYTGSTTVSTPTTSLTGLNAGSSYAVAVVATNSAGTSNTSAMTAETIPAAPTGLTASNPSTGTTMDLSWSPSTGADNYTVYWSDNSPDNVTIDPDNASTFDGSQTFTISQLSNCSGTCRGTVTGLDNGTNYDFTVVATNTGGNSSPATEINATPVYVAPGITVTHNAGPTPQNTHDNQTMVNEAGYATGFVEWSVTGTGYGVGNWADITRDSAGNIYHTQYYNGYPTVIKRNSVGVEQCSSSLTGVSTSNTSTLSIGGLEIDSENNAYLIGETNSGINGETALGLTDVVVVKFSSECSGGTLPTIWTKQIGTSADDRAEVARIHNDVLYIRANTKGDWGATHSGERTSQNDPLRESVHLKMDTDGNILSNTQINESIDTYTLKNMVIDSNGDYYETGTAFWFVGYANLATTTKSIDGEDCSVQDWSSGNLRCSVIRKYNSNHVRQWTKTFATKETVFQSIQLNSDETKIITVGTSRTDFNGVTKTPTHISSYHYPILVNSISPTNGSINWTKFTGQSGGGYNQGTPLASRDMREGENALGLDESDNIFIAHKMFFYGNEMPNGGNHSRQFNRITKLDSDGNSIWSRAFGGEKKQYSSGNVPSESLYSTHVTKGGQIYLTGSNFYGQDSFNPKGSKLYKIDGSFDNYTTPMLDAEVGFDYFTLNLTGPTPTQNVTWNWTSDNTSQMITMYGVAATPGQVNNEHLLITGRPNDPIYVYVAAIQDNVSDGDTVVNVNISTTSADSNWNGLNFTVPVTVIDQSQTFPPSDPYVTLGFDNGSITEGNSGTQTRTLRATLDAVATSPVTINLAASSGGVCTAAEGSDFSYPTSSITIPAGQSEGTDNVTINGDTDTEENEIACIDVVSVTNGIEDGTQQARLNILMDPPIGTAFINTGTTKVTSNKPEIEIRWNKSGVTEQDSFNLYYGKSNTFDNSLQINLNDNTTYEGVITINKENRNYYYHGGLDVGKYYYYLLTANNNAGFTTDNVTIHLSSAVQDFPKSTLNTDNDTALLVYYDFDNTTSSGLTNLSTIPSNPSDYDLISGGGAAIEFGESKFQNADSSTNEAAYLNSTGGYVYNDNFNSDNESLDNFTISMWVYPDQDMPTFASAFATGDDTTKNNFQISDNGSSGIITITENKSQWLEAGTIAQDNWTHMTAVKYADNNTLVLYLNGVVGINNMLSCPDNTKDSCADNNSLTTFNTNWEKLKIGVNRVSQSPWKGYIDEVKVYNRPLNSTEVNNLYRCDNPGGYGTCR